MQRAGAPSPTGKALRKDWVTLVPRKEKKEPKLLTWAPIPDPRLRGQARVRGPLAQGRQRGAGLFGTLGSRVGSQGKGWCFNSPLYPPRPSVCKFNWEWGLELGRGPWADFLTQRQDSGLRASRGLRAGGPPSQAAVPAGCFERPQVR